MISSYEDLIKKECFQKLKQYLVEKMNNSSNIFDILNASNYEIRHSRYLAWLFKNSNLLKLLLDIDIPEKLEVYTEYTVCDDDEYKKNGRIDILIKSDNFVCVIENKYGSKEHSKQCQRYRKFIEKFFENSVKKYIFLDIYKPNEELFEKGKELEGYESITYRDLLGTFKDEKFKLNEDNDFNEKVLGQYKKIINSNYDFDKEEKEECSEVLKEDGVIEVLLKPYKYDESKPDDCMTIYKLQTYMWAYCLTKGNELIKKIYSKLLSEKKLKSFNSIGEESEYESNNYGVYRCVPNECNYEDLECLNFGKIYNPIMHIAIFNNLSISEGKEYGINISIELATCEKDKEQQRENLYKAINKVLETNYSTKNWKTIQQEQIISRKDYFGEILGGKTIDESIVNDKKINNIITTYKEILNNFK